MRKLCVFWYGLHLSSLVTSELATSIKKKLIPDKPSVAQRPNV
jgi:hypothetical protein